MLLLLLQLWLGLYYWFGDRRESFLSSSLPPLSDVGCPWRVGQVPDQSGNRVRGLFVTVSVPEEVRVLGNRPDGFGLAPGVSDLFGYLYDSQESRMSRLPNRRKLPERSSCRLRPT